jgi:hypothetical protein
MGPYIQIGICTKLIVEQAGIARVKTSVDEVAAAISEQSIDLSLFAKTEDTGQGMHRVNLIEPRDPRGVQTCRVGYSEVTWMKLENRRKSSTL